MTFLRVMLLSFVAILAVNLSKARSANCNGCNIVYQFGISGIEIGGTYELRDGTEVIVVDVDFGARRVEVRKTDSLYYFWVSADDIFGKRTAPWSRSTDNPQYTGLVASCASLAAARADGNMIGMFLMERACCQSAASRAYPEVSDPHCK